MSDQQIPVIVLMDAGIDAAWEALIRNQFDSTTTVYYKLNATDAGYFQAERIYSLHPGAKDVHFFASKSNTSAELSLGSSTYPDGQALAFHLSFLSLGNTLIKGWITSVASMDTIPRFEGSNQDDYFANTLQDVVIDGKGGLDTLTINGSRTQHNILSDATAAQQKIVHQAAFPGATLLINHSGIDALFNIERLQFSDRNVALDLDDGDSANTALRILTAVVGKESLTNQALLGEIIAYTDQFDLGTLAQVLIDAGVLAQFAGGSSDAHLIQHLYKNIAGQGPSQAELQWTLDFVANNGFTQTDILETMIMLPQTGAQAQLIAQTQVGVDYLPYALL